MAAAIKRMKNFTTRCNWKGGWCHRHASNLQNHRDDLSFKNDRASGSKSIDSEPVEDERRLSYCEMLKQRRAEAERSIIVEFTFGTNIQHLSNKLKSVGGRIKDAFYYKMNTKGYVLFEFASAEAVQKHTQTDRLDTGRLLCFHEKNLQSHRRQLPSFISKDALMGVNFDIRQLDSANSLSQQIQILHYYLKMRQKQKRCQFFVCNQVQETVRKLYPDAVVLPFGSGATGLGLATGSDLDMVMMVNKPPEENFINSNLSYASLKPDPRYDQSTNYLHKAGSLLRLSAGIVETEQILRARVPIIKFKHSFTGLECDLSSNSYSGVIMSQILYTMCQFDARFHPLVTVIKTWGRASNVTQKTPFQGFSSFMLNVLVMHFLQTRKQPVLPAIRDMYRPDVDEAKVKLLSTQTEESFLKDVSQIPRSQNTQSTGDLLMEFFQYFANFDFTKYTIDLHNGLCLDLPGQKCIRIINPCEKDHNICRNVKQRYLQHFQEKCKITAERLETKVKVCDKTPWGLSYLINPALTMDQNKGQSSTFNLEDSLRTNSLNIKELYKEEEFTVETENYNKNT